MCSRHAEYGAGYDIDQLQADGAQEAYPLARYRVLVEDEEGGRWFVSIFAHDMWEAKRICKQRHPELTPLGANYVEEAE